MILPIRNTVDVSFNSKWYLVIFTLCSLYERSRDCQEEISCCCILWMVKDTYGTLMEWSRLFEHMLISCQFWGCFSHSLKVTRWMETFEWESRSSHQTCYWLGRADTISKDEKDLEWIAGDKDDQNELHYIGSNAVGTKVCSSIVPSDQRS